MSDDEVDKLIASAMRDIIETAAKDGIITQEELDLIDFAELSLKKLKKELDEIYRDGVITHEEQEKIIRFKEKIIDSATNLADFDERISRDELAMLMAYMIGIKIPRIGEIS